MSPVPAKARIFISHSAKEPEAQAVQAALVAELTTPERQPRFGLLLDKVTLEPGDMWRSRINLWVGGCDAALVLLSKAALESAYVAYEVSILSYRAAMKDSLLLIPILLEEVSDEDLKKSRLSPAQLPEVQFVRGAGKTAEAIAGEVVTKLEKEVRTGTTPLERRAQHLADLLDFEPVHLSAAGHEVALDLDAWIPSEEKLRLRLAAQLLSVGMLNSARALATLLGKIPRKDDKVLWLEKVLKLVGSAWVDPRSFDRLPRIAKGMEKVAAVGVNASKKSTAEMYLVCASCGDPEDTWRWLECADVYSVGDTTPDVIEKLSRKVEEAVASKLACDPEDVHEELELLNSIFPQPVIVFLQAAGKSDEILAALRDRFKHVTFFLLMGKDRTSAPRLSEEVIEILFPELAPDDEDLFLERYRKLEGTLRVR